MEFPEGFNQLELLKTHGHLIPRGASSLWPGEEEEEEVGLGEDEEDEEGHGERGEEWCAQREERLRGRPQELMLWAAENNRLSTVRKLLSDEPTLVRCRDQDGYTPLHRAAYGDHVLMVSALLAAGAEIDPQTVDGWTPLHSACRWGRVAAATLLLRRGAELNAQTNGGLTPLHLAAAHTSPSPSDSSHTLELLLAQRHLQPGIRSSGGETAGAVARRSGPHHYLFEMVEDCTSVLPPR